MLVEAHVDNVRNTHVVSLRTNGVTQTLAVPGRPDAGGSAVNGGELLCLAMATCYCNDIYREATRRGLDVTGVEIRADAEFGAEGQPASRLSYSVSVRARATESAIRDLITHTDKVAEVHNTLR